MPPMPHSECNLTGIAYGGHTANSNAATVPVSRQYMPSPASIVAERTALLHLISTFNGSGWSSVAFGEISVWKVDTTGVSAGK